MAATDIRNRPHRHVHDVASPNMVVFGQEVFGEVCDYFRTTLVEGNKLHREVVLVNFENYSVPLFHAGHTSRWNVSVSRAMGLEAVNKFSYRFRALLIGRQKRAGNQIPLRNRLSLKYRQRLVPEPFDVVLGRTKQVEVIRVQPTSHLLVSSEGVCCFG